MKQNSPESTFAPYKWLIAALGVILLLGASSVAQHGTGTISGRAVDRGAAVLPGARVKIEPGDITGATNAQGEFTFIGVAPGDYTVTISYVGFSTFTQQVKVTAGQVTHVEGVMEVSAHSEEITVVADAYGQAEAINEQRTSDNILDVMPEGVIKSLPNANIADVVGRMPGVSLERDEGEGKYVQVRGTEPRLNNTTVDGVELPAPEDNVRQFKLDTIPSGIVESVEVNKTLAANQDADAIGGTVNLVTKKAGDLPTLQVEGFGGFTPIENTRYVGLVNGTVGQRFGKDKRFGALFSGSYDYNGRGIDDIEPQPDFNYLRPVYDSMDIREYRYQRKRYGFGGSLDYKLKDPASGLYLHYFGSDFKDYGNKWVYTLNDDVTPSPQGPTGTPIIAPDVPKFKTSQRAPDYSAGSLAIGGKHVFSNSWLSWEVSAAESRELAAAGNPGATFKVLANNDTAQLPLTGTCQFEPSLTTNFHLPQWDPACLAPGSPIYNPSNYYLAEYDGTQGPTFQVNLQGATSYAKNYHLGSHFSTFEFGFKLRNTHKGQNAYSPTYDNANCVDGNGVLLPGFAGCTMSNFLSGFTNPSYYFKAFNLGPVTNYPTIVNKFQTTVGGVPYVSLDEPATLFGSMLSNFDLTERVSAGYAMNTIEFGRFRLQTGLRIEATQLNILGYSTINNSSSTDETIVPQLAQSWYWDPLPSVQLRYRITDDSDIRAVYARAISRPNPYDMVPYVTLDESTNPYTVTVGNPNLKPEHANDYDVLYEHYLKPYGEFQAGFYYKQLSQPIYYILDPNNSGTQCQQIAPTPPCNLSYIINGVNAKLYGVEFAYIQHLGFLPGALSGFGISANYSKTGSSAGTLPLRTDNPALQRQTPTMWNLGPTYDKGRFSARLGATYNSASIYQYQWNQCTPANSALGVCEDPSSLGPKGPAGDNYLYAHLQVDAQASFRVQRTLTVLWQGLNMTNMVFGFYNGSPWYVTQREYYHPTYSFGLRWEPRRQD